MTSDKIRFGYGMFWKFLWSNPTGGLLVLCTLTTVKSIIKKLSNKQLTFLCDCGSFREPFLL